MEKSGEAHVRFEIQPPIAGRGPTRMLRERLTPQLIGDAERLARPQASDPLTPVSPLASRAAPQSRETNSLIPRAITISCFLAPSPGRNARVLFRQGVFVEVRFSQ
jgi:hypothetical protein